MDEAIALMARADQCLVVGTSLNVYPAAGLLHYLPRSSSLHVVDPSDLPLPPRPLRHIKEKASTGVPMLASELIASLSAR